MRLAGREKMGYYPTPVTIVDAMKTFLSFPGAHFSALDPCCGEGSALERLVQDSKGATYGVELDQSRADQSRSRLRHVLRCGIEETRMAHRSCSLLFLNPPYDEATLEEDAHTKTERKEKAFLRMTVQYLMAGGVLVYIIPQYRLDRTMARMLAYIFEQMRVFRFPDSEYDAFRQIVLFGVRRSRNTSDGDKAATLERVPLPKLPALGQAEDPVYSIPPSEPLKLFCSTIIDPEELEVSLGKSPLWNRFHEKTLRNDLKGPGRPCPSTADTSGCPWQLANSTEWLAQDRIFTW